MGKMSELDLCVSELRSAAQSLNTVADIQDLNTSDCLPTAVRDASISSSRSLSVALREIQSHCLKLYGNLRIPASAYILRSKTCTHFQETES